MLTYYRFVSYDVSLFFLAKEYHKYKYRKTHNYPSNSRNHRLVPIETIFSRPYRYNCSKTSLSKGQLYPILIECHTLYLIICASLSRGIPDPSVSVCISSLSPPLRKLECELSFQISYMNQQDPYSLSQSFRKCQFLLSNNIIMKQFEKKRFLCLSQSELNSFIEYIPGFTRTVCDH